MPSRSRQRWNDERLRGLDELEAAHRAITRSGGGRRAASLQINQAYTLLLSSQFQGFCRELYSEAANLLLDHLAPQPPLRVVVRNQFTVGLKLDHGNPSPGNLEPTLAGSGSTSGPSSRPAIVGVPRAGSRSSD